MKKIYLHTKHLTTSDRSATQSNVVSRFIKQLMLSLFLLMIVQGAALAQTTLYSEDFGLTTTWPTGWSTSGTYQWQGSTNGGTGYTGASGSGSALHTTAQSQSGTLNFSNNLSTVGYKNITVLWGAMRVGTNTATFEYSTNGTTWNTVTFTDDPNDGTNWSLVNGGNRITLPAGAENATNLRFRWTHASVTSPQQYYRLDDFSVQGTPPPTITNLGSSSGCEGTSITINGTSLTGATAANVKIGGTPVTSITSQSNTQIIAVIGGGTTGTVSVTTSGGTATSAATFTVNPLPTTIIVTGGGPHSDPATLTASNGGSGTIYFQGNTSGGTSTVTPSTSQVVNTAGTYYFRARSAAGCWGEEGSATVTFCTSPLPSLTATVINVSCPPATNDGSIVMNNLPYGIQFTRANNNYIDLGSSYLSNRSAFTMEGWIKFNAAQTVNTGIFGQNDAIEFIFQSATEMRCWTPNGGSLNINFATYNINDNNWHHIAVVGNGTNILIYFDGIQRASGGSATSNYGNSNYTTKIGGNVQDPNTQPFSGQIMKTGFYSTALSASAIASLASEFTNYTGSESGLLAAYNFYEGSSTSLTRLPAGTNGTFQPNTTSRPTWIEPFTYAWTKTGDVGFSKTTRSITALTSGEYNLSTSLGSCPKTKSWTVSANNTPTIATISSLASLCVGTSLNPTAPTLTANGSAVTAQGWQLGGVNITVPYTVSFADNGKSLQYYATNGCGTATSNQVIVTVNALPIITNQPTALTLYEGGSGSFTVGTSASSPSYQWQYSISGSDPWLNTAGTIGVIGHTLSQLSISNVPAEWDGVYISCLVTSNGCSTRSNTALLTIKAIAIWVGAKDSNWEEDLNWSAGFKPTPGANVEFATADNNPGLPAANNLYLPVGIPKTIGNLTNASAKNLIVPANASLTVNGVITIMNPGTAINSIDPSRILIKAAPETPNGTLIFNNPQNSPVYGSVEFYSKASWDKTKLINSGEIYNWQYFGIPVKTVKASPTFDGAYVRKKQEAGTTSSNHWEQLNNNSEIQQFLGYEICQENPTTYLIKGELINSNFSSGQLAKTLTAAYPGQHLFSNPYTAAIDIRYVDFGSGMEATAYLYNTGTFNQWNANTVKTGTLAGQYFVIPKSHAGDGGLTNQVPSMGTMLVQVNSATPNAYLNIVYDSVVMKNVVPMRVKSIVEQELKPKVLTTIEVQGDKTSDKMWLFYDDIYTHGFDNSFDGRKMPSSALNCQLYAVESDGNYQVNSIPNLANTQIAFQAGVDTEFTMTFNHENLQEKYTNLYLYDTVEDKVVDITNDGSTYKFTAISTPKPAQRFKLFSKNEAEVNASNSKITYFIDNNVIRLMNFSNEKGSVQLFDISGRLISNSTIAPLGFDLIPVQSQHIYLLKITVEGETTVNKLIVR